MNSPARRKGMHAWRGLGRRAQSHPARCSLYIWYQRHMHACRATCTGSSLPQRRPHRQAACFTQGQEAVSARCLRPGSPPPPPDPGRHHPGGQGCGPAAARGPGPRNSPGLCWACFGSRQRRVCARGTPFAMRTFAAPRAHGVAIGAARRNEAAERDCACAGGGPAGRPPLTTMTLASQQASRATAVLCRDTRDTCDTPLIVPLPTPATAHRHLQTALPPRRCAGCSPPAPLGCKWNQSSRRPVSRRGSLHPAPSRSAAFLAQASG